MDYGSWMAALGNGIWIMDYGLYIMDHVLDMYIYIYIQHIYICEFRYTSINAETDKSKLHFPFSGIYKCAYERNACVKSIRDRDAISALECEQGLWIQAPGPWIWATGSGILQCLVWYSRLPFIGGGVIRKYVHMVHQLSEVQAFGCVLLPTCAKPQTAHHAGTHLVTSLYTYLCACFYTCIHSHAYFYTYTYIYIYIYICRYDA